MRLHSVFVFTVVLFLVAPLSASASQWLQTMQSDHSFHVDVHSASSSIEAVNVNGSLHIKNISGEKVNRSRHGAPNLPSIQKWVVIPQGTIEVNVNAFDPTVLSNVDVPPIAKDKFEKEPESLQLRNPSLYRAGYEIVNYSAESYIGPFRILKMTINPHQYDHDKKQLIIYDKIEIKVATEGDFNSVKALRSTPFTRAQIHNLTINGKDLGISNSRTDATRMLVLTTEDLLEPAQKLKELYHSEQTFVEVKTVSSGISSRSLKSTISDEYSAGNLNSVLIFGDEQKIKLYYWTNYTPGDSWYSYLSGNDYIADIGLGRIPVSNQTEADHILRKMQKFTDVQSTGHSTRKFMLAAHKENYPGKYTANQERIRNADNPREFSFTTMYGGAGAVNSDVVQEVPESYAIINYRGHGNNTSWIGWDRNGRSFGSREIDQLENFDENLAIFFNIACSNGSLQYSDHSMAENLLFRSPHSDLNHGAVAVLAATVESQTYTNHDYDEYLFEYLQTSDDVTLGTINGLAANRLVRDNGGRLPSNNRMYILFGSPEMKPSMGL